MHEMDTNRKNYYFSTEKMCVGYGGKPLVKEMEIALPKGEH